MPWKTSRPQPADPGRYRNDHPRKVKQARAALAAAGRLPCATPGCTLGGWLYAHDLERDGRRDPRSVHLDHCPWCKGGCACCVDGYRGLGHRRCNVDDGARRGRARQTITARRL